MCPSCAHSWRSIWAIYDPLRWSEDLVLHMKVVAVLIFFWPSTSALKWHACLLRLSRSVANTYSLCCPAELPHLTITLMYFCFGGLRRNHFLEISWHLRMLTVCQSVSALVIIFPERFNLYRKVLTVIENIWCKRAAQLSLVVIGYWFLRYEAYGKSVNEQVVATGTVVVCAVLDRIKILFLVRMLSEQYSIISCNDLILLFITYWHVLLCFRNRMY